MAQINQQDRAWHSSKMQDFGTLVGDRFMLRASERSKEQTHLFESWYIEALEMLNECLWQF
jgi:hypothetical protein